MESFDMFRQSCILLRNLFCKWLPKNHHRPTIWICLSRLTNMASPRSTSFSHGKIICFFFRVSGLITVCAVCNRTDGSLTGSSRWKNQGLIPNHSEVTQPIGKIAGFISLPHVSSNYPLVMTIIAMENGHGNSGYFPWIAWWFKP